MKKLSILLITVITLSSCSGDALVTENFLSQNYDTSTKNIDISAMNLTVIPDFSQYGSGTSFSGATRIDISGNDITQLELSKLSYFKDLRDINLSDNKIVTIDDLSLNVDVLDLSNNKIERITFKEDAILRDLYLSGNVLTNGEFIAIPPKLVKLDLSSNKLEDIQGLGNGEKLTYLDISNNFLEDQDLSALIGKNTIRYLDIIGNPEMSTSRIERMNIFNQKYIDDTTFQARPKETLSGSLNQ